MREIKFRAWDTAKKKMWSAEEMGADQEALLPDGRGFANISGDDTRLSQIHSHLLPLQYTGLRDKNGKEIYEGDIVKAGTINGTKVDKDGMAEDFDYPVETQFIIRDIRKLPFEGNRHDGGWFEYGELEIIGNIYENPELLKEEH